VYFSVGFYVCSLSFPGGRSLAAPPTPFARAVPDKQGAERTNRLWSLAVAASGSAGLATDSGDSEPDLATKPGPLRQSSRTRGYLFLGSQSKLRFSSYECDQLFAWPTDQPRHATYASTYPIETRSPPFFLFLDAPHSSLGSRKP